MFYSVRLKRYQILSYLLLANISNVPYIVTNPRMLSFIKIVMSFITNIKSNGICENTHKTHILSIKYLNFFFFYFVNGNKILLVAKNCFFCFRFASRAFVSFHIKLFKYFSLLSVVIFNCWQRTDLCQITSRVYSDSF